MSFSYESHEPGCTPIHPCNNCAISSFLRQTLGKENFAKSVELCDTIPDKESNLEKTIGELFGDTFSARTLNCLRNDNFKTLADLLDRSQADLLRIPNFGQISLSEVKEGLAKMGHRLRPNS